jgi:hypothetical protein
MDLDLQDIVNFANLGFLLVFGWLLKSYVPSYLDRKAANLATKEDFDQLLELEKKSTREIEAIKGEVSKSTWLEQRRWDLRRDVYVELLEALYEFQLLSGSLSAWYAPGNLDHGNPERRNLHDKEFKRFLAAQKQLGKVAAPAPLVVGEEIVQAITEFAFKCRALDGEEDPRRYYIGLQESATSVSAMILQAARRDLLGA